MKGEHYPVIPGSHPVPLSTHMRIPDIPDIVPPVNQPLVNHSGSLKTRSYKLPGDICYLLLCAVGGTILFIRTSVYTSILIVPIGEGPLFGKWGLCHK